MTNQPVFTVGQLIKALAMYPDDAIVLVGQDEITIKSLSTSILEEHAGSPVLEIFEAAPITLDSRIRHLVNPDDLNGEFEHIGEVMRGDDEEILVSLLFEKLECESDRCRQVVLGQLNRAWNLGYIEIV